MCFGHSGQKSKSNRAPLNGHTGNGINTAGVSRGGAAAAPAAPGALHDGPAMIMQSDARDFSTSKTKERFKNFSRKFERKPRQLDVSGMPQQSAAYHADGAIGARHNQGTVLDDLNGDAEKMSTSTASHSHAHSNSNTTSSSTASSSPVIRPPLHHRLHSQIFASSPDFKLPDLPWLCGTWYVTHTSLSLWHQKRDVRVTYTRLPGERLEEVVQYTLPNGKMQTIRGIDSVRPDGSYIWRPAMGGMGVGTLRRGFGRGGISPSSWEVLGWGGGGNKEEAARNTELEQWVVVWHAGNVGIKPGVDIYARSPKGLTERRLRRILKSLKDVARRVDEERRSGASSQDTGEFETLVGRMFLIPQANRL